MGSDKEASSETRPSETDSKRRDIAWEEHASSQLHYFQSLSLRQKLEAVQGMADVVRRLEQMRVHGRLR